MKKWYYLSVSGLGGLLGLGEIFLVIALVTDSWVVTDISRLGLFRSCSRDFIDGWVCEAGIEKFQQTTLILMSVGFLFNIIAAATYRKTPVCAAFEILSGAVSAAGVGSFANEFTGGIDKYFGYSFKLGAAGSAFLLISGVALVGLSGSQKCTMETFKNGDVEETGKVGAGGSMQV